MSRVGNKIITVPEGVNLDLNDHLVTVTGPKGTMSFKFRPEVSLEVKEGKVSVKVGNGPKANAHQGTTRQIIADMITGVNQGWSKTLEVVGTGFRANVEGQKLVLSVGFSHRVEINPPEGITFAAAENKITVSGVSKVLVGKTAAEIKEVRPPDAYKGKGIRFLGERIKLKPGKAAKVGGTGK